MDLGSLTASLGVDTRGLEKAERRYRAFANKIEDRTEKLKKTVFGLQGALVSLGVGLSVKKALDAFSVLDKGLIAVQKTTNMTDQQIQKLNENIRKMSLQVPVATEGLLEIAEAAGQLGVQGVANVTLFTETLAKLQISSDVVGAEGAKSLARLLNTAGEGTEKIKTLGSVIVSLGNQMAASEKEIVHMAGEIGRATAAYEVSSETAAAYGAALKAMGARAEISGSAISKSMILIEKSLLKGGESLAFLERVTQKTGAELKKTFAQDAGEVFTAFIKGLNRMTKEGHSAVELLGEFGIKGVEGVKGLTPLIKNVHQLEKALKIANKEVKNATALDLEAINATKSFSAQMQLFWNAIDQVAAGIGKGLAPAIVDLTVKFRDWVKANDEFIQKKVPDAIQDLTQGFKTLGDVVTWVGEGITGLYRGWVWAKKALLEASALAQEIKLFANLGEASEGKIRRELTATREVINSLSIALVELDKSYSGNAQIASGVVAPAHVAVRNAIAQTISAMEDGDGAAKTLTDSTVELKEVAALTAAEIQHLENRLTELAWTAGQTTRDAFRLMKQSMFFEHDIAIGMDVSTAEDINQEIAATKDLFDQINESLAEQSDLFDSSIFGDAATENIQNMAATLGKIAEMYDKIAKKEDHLNDLREKANKITDPDDKLKALKQIHQLETRYAEDALNAQISGYRELSHTISLMFDENSTARQAFHAAEMAFTTAEIAIGMQKALVNAVASVTSAGQGDPYTAFARVAAMAAMMAAVLANIGETFSFSGGSAPSSYSGGTYLSDQSGEWATENLSDVYDILLDYDAKQYGALLDIFYEIRKLNTNINNFLVGVKTGLAEFEVAGYETQTGGYSMPSLPGWDSLPYMDSFIGQFLSGFISSFMDEAISYIFGGDKRTELLTVGMTQRAGQDGQGRGGVPMTLADLMSGENVPLMWYAWLEETTGGGMFGEDSSRRFTEYMEQGSEFNQMVNDIFRNIVSSIMGIAEIFGFTADEIEEFFNSFEINLPNLTDLDKMSDEEIEAAFEAYFANFADTVAEGMFGDLIREYRDAGEGFYEAAVRIATEMVIVQEAINMTGNVVETSVEGWIELSQALIDAAGSLDELMEGIQTYFEEFMTEAEQQAYLYKTLTQAFETLGIAMPATREEFKALVESLDLTTEEGQALYVALLDLAGATDAYYDAVEKATQTIIDAKRKLLGTEDEGALGDINSRYGWEIASESDAFEYIQAFINATEEELKAYADAHGVTVEDLTDDIMWLAEYFGWLDEAVEEAGDAAEKARIDFVALRDSIESTLFGISDTFGGGSSADQIMSQIVGMQGIPMSEMTGDILLDMSNKLVQWYNAAVAEAQAVAREEQAAANLLIQVSDRLSSLVTQIDSTIRSIKYSGLNLAVPTLKAEEAQGDYSALLSAAMGGGTAEVQEYLGFAQTYLQQQQEAYKSSTAYQEKYASVMTDMEYIKSVAETGGYDAAILAELERGNEQTEADLSGIQATFSQFEGWILNALQTLETMDMILHIDWANFEGDMAEALGYLTQLVEVYGWDHEYTLQFIADIPMDLFSDLNDLAYAAGFIADASGGWNSTATVSFLKNVAENWEWENIDEILHSVGFVAAQAGSWTADATINFITALMDRSGTELVDMPYWLEQMGLDDTQIPDIMAALILQAEGGGIPIDDIDDYLTGIGIVDANLQRKIKINLIYDMVSSGDLDFKDVATYVYNQAFAAWIMEDENPQAISILEDLTAISQMWGGANAYNLGADVNHYGGYESNPSDWMNLWTKHGLPNRWAEGGIINSPSLGWVGEAGYPEAIIPMKDGMNIPVKWVNGGSTQSGAEKGERPLNIIVQVGNQEFDAHISHIADNVRVKAERRPIGPRRI